MTNKMVELLSDGGKRTTIIDLNEGIARSSRDRGPVKVLFQTNYLEKFGFPKWIDFQCFVSRCGWNFELLITSIKYKDRTA
ncbi:hypothetical protein FHR92_003929 [Fontibacillus solani]|uniref:Uncharacterized protein n=1 Tax=Fontibacillus solani TaxID=1572857 RepID=A0A7W3SWE1_9BACL|nr:hypothetical protein [Fontibacillus solani]